MLAQLALLEWSAVVVGGCHRPRPSRVLDRDGLLAVRKAGVGGQLERDAVADLGLEALHIIVVHEDVRPRAVFADEAVGLAQRDDLARVPLAA